MTPAEQAAVFDHVLGRLDAAGLTARLGFDPWADPARARALVDAAAGAGDGDAIEAAWMLAGVARAIDASIVPTAIALLPRTCHRIHEELARALQHLADPRAINALVAAARAPLPHLDEDDFHAFARKCTWALADIGGDEARAALEVLAAEPDPTIAAYARRRLDRWDEEAGRKGRRR